ncbi:MAG: hypothetical protein IPN68_00225 [Bacteroidetes bacterium]|nr:hypothetical protein [Bacteroidota bacterium]
MKRLSTFFYLKVLSVLVIVIVFNSVSVAAVETSVTSIKVEYSVPGAKCLNKVELPKISQSGSANVRISIFRDQSYQIVIHEIDRNYYTEVNGEVQALTESGSCLTLRIIFPVKGEKWIWFSGLDSSVEMKEGMIYTDTISTRTTIPPAGAFNGKDLSSGGYGDAVGMGTMSYYPLCALSAGPNGSALGVDLSLPVVYRLSGEKNKGLIAEFDLATSPLTKKFPGRAFFKLSRYDFNSEWGMRAALKTYYNIYNDAFKKRVINEGIWLPFTAMRTIPGWEDFGFAYHETSWGSSDTKDGVKTPNIISDRGTGVLSFQYTEPWDVQIPIKSKTIPYDSVVSEKLLPVRHMDYLKVSATKRQEWFVADKAS